MLDNFVKHFRVFFTVAVTGMAACVYIFARAAAEAFFAEDEQRFLLGTIAFVSGVLLVGKFVCLILGLSQAGDRDEFAGVKTRQALVSFASVLAVLVPMFVLTLMMYAE